MSQIIAAQIVCDVEDGGLFVLDTMGRVWTGYFKVADQKWTWFRVELPEDTA